MLGPALSLRSCLSGSIASLPLSPRFPISSAFLGGFRAATTLTRMACRSGSGERPKDPSSNPKVVKLRQVIAAEPAGSSSWEKCWEEGLTPWDLQQPTPVFVHLLQSGALPKGRVLIPGCGSGHDVTAIAGRGRDVVGLDISETAIKKAKELASSSPNANCFTFLVADFFTYDPSELFDLIIDYTFFCAIEPSMRSSWAQKIGDILKPDGELITLMYPIFKGEGGPPYSVPFTEYEKVLNPIGFKAFFLQDNHLAIEQRKGIEKLARWKRFPNQSTL